MSRRLAAALAAFALTVIAACGGDSGSPTEPAPPPPPPPGPRPVASVQVNPPAANLVTGATQALQATLKDADGKLLTGRTVMWSSSAEAIASVSNAGVVTALAAGNAFITATSEGKSAKATISVAAPQVPVASVAVGAAPDTIEAWDELQLTAVTRDAGNNVLTGRAITWTSSNPAVASIDATTGKLTGLDRGTVTLTATSEGKSGTAKLVVVIKYRSITAGTMHACDIASGGIVWCWGLNGAEGRIGDPAVGNGSMSPVPVKVPGGHRFTQISTFGRHTCGVTTDSKAYCWGTNSWGSLGSGTNIAQSYTPVPVAGAQSFRKVTTGSDHSCGITLANKAYCWGNNDWRQLGTGNNTIANAPVAVHLAEDVTDIAAGPAFTCAVAVSGKSYCWGANSIGQVGDGKQIAYGNVFVALPSQVVGGHLMKQVDAGNQYACGLTVGGSAFCWGSNNTKFGNGPQNDSSTPVAVSGGIAFQSISTGFGHACGVAADYALYCWGSNGNGQLGIAATFSNVPARAANNMFAAEVAAAGIGTGSGAHTCAIAKDRLTVQCWGRNDVGQLGNGGTTAGSAVNPAPAVVVGQKPLPIS